MKVNFSGATHDLSQTLAMRVDSYSHTALFGPREARISVGGDPESLGDLFAWLSQGVIIQDDLVGPVWWGYVSRVDVRVGALTVTRDIEDMANYIRVMDQIGTAVVAQDAVSIAAYGQHEFILSLAGDEIIDATRDAAAATALRVMREPATRALVEPSSSISASRGADAGAVIYCRGPAYSLAWRYVDVNSDDVTTVDSTVAIKEIIDAKGPHVGSSAALSTSGTLVTRAQDGTRKALDVVTELLTAGDGTTRLYLAPTPGLPASAKHGVLIDKMPLGGPTSGLSVAYYVDTAGRVLGPDGSPVEPATLRAGFWAATKDFWSVASPGYSFFVETGTFDVASQAWTWEAGGRQDKFSGMRITAG